jgi:hypothetical protein
VRVVIADPLAAALTGAIAIVAGTVAAALL